MNRVRTLACLLLALTVVAVPATAEIGTIDVVPAATLLLPYFEVDLDNAGGNTTLFSINNAEAGPVIAHVTLWTDLSVPTLDFNVYLTGYDVVTMNLRDLFVAGVTPQTEHVNDADSISPVGDFSLVSNPATGVGPGSASCNGQLPLPALPQILLDHIRAAHTGGPSAVFSNRCSGVNHPDNIARGYITIDNVNFCSLDFPGDAGYFILGGAGVANNNNVLWGDYFLVSDALNSAQGYNLVHIEAEGGTGSGLGAANYTFYRRYSGGADQREGLASTWAARFGVKEDLGGGVDYLVWRDAKVSVAPFVCGALPSPFPLGQTQIVVFDEQENPEVPESSPFSPAIPGTSFIPFPWETNRTRIGSANFPTAYPVGWTYLNLNTAVAGSQVPFEPVTQNYVQVLWATADKFSIGFDGIQLDNVTDPAVASNVELPVCDGAPDPAGC